MAQVKLALKSLRNRWIHFHSKHNSHLYRRQHKEKESYLEKGKLVPDWKWNFSGFGGFFDE